MLRCGPGASPLLCLLKLDHLPGSRACFCRSFSPASWSVFSGTAWSFHPPFSYSDCGLLSTPSSWLCWICEWVCEPSHAPHPTPPPPGGTVSTSRAGRYCAEGCCEHGTQEGKRPCHSNRGWYRGRRLVWGGIIFSRSRILHQSCCCFFSPRELPHAIIFCLWSKSWPERACRWRQTREYSRLRGFSEWSSFSMKPCQVYIKSSHAWILAVSSTRHDGIFLNSL